MRHHEHYCGWEIEWEVKESGAVYFWIEAEYPRTKPNTVLIDRHHVGIFKSSEQGCQKTKELIDLLFHEIRLLKVVTIKSFQEDLANSGILHAMTDEDCNKVPKFGL